MKIGVSAFAWTTRMEERHLDLLDGLRAGGLDAVEIPIFDPATIDAARIRRAFDAADLECTVCAILPQHVNPISEDAAERKLAHAHLERLSETVAELGARRFGGPLYAPIGYRTGRRRTQAEWEWAVEAFQSMTPPLDANGLELAIEPVNRGETFFLNTAVDAAALCDAIGHPRVGVLIDTCHANIEEKNIAAAVRSLGPRLRHMHMSENDRRFSGDRGGAEGHWLRRHFDDRGLRIFR